MASAFKRTSGEGASSPPSPLPARTDREKQCEQCGTKRTHHWRRDVKGVLLCNACGLRQKRQSNRRKDQEDLAPAKTAAAPAAMNANRSYGREPVYTIYTHPQQPGSAQGFVQSPLNYAPLAMSMSYDSPLHFFDHYLPLPVDKREVVSKAQNDLHVTAHFKDISDPLQHPLVQFFSVSDSSPSVSTSNLQAGFINLPNRYAQTAASPSHMAASPSGSFSTPILTSFAAPSTQPYSNSTVDVSITNSSTNSSNSSNTTQIASSVISS